MIDSALFNALKSNGRQGAPDLQSSNAPVAAGEGPSPSPSPVSPLFSVLQQAPAQGQLVADAAPPPKGGQVPDPDPKKAKEFVDGMSKQPDIWQNILNGLGLGTKK